ncbi:MAG: hypothetical protein K9N11_02230 [Lentisphaeria bacterium]|nr:hypothetical protein [Candidatus Neomarinimicrobiota bacterium]MCF7841648.1 hypothetical protein [Lentisphaeria bacterium]
MTKKLAFATNDGETIHAHFGQAQYYEIVELDDSGITSRERVPKFGLHGSDDSASHGHGQGQGHAERHGGGGMGHGMGRGERHRAMFERIAGCDYLVARGMGESAVMNAAGTGLQVILCDEKTIDAAVEKFLRGELMHNSGRVHKHH